MRRNCNFLYPYLIHRRQKPEKSAADPVILGYVNPQFTDFPGKLVAFFPVFGDTVLTKGCDAYDNRPADRTEAEGKRTFAGSTGTSLPRPPPSPERNGPMCWLHWWPSVPLTTSTNPLSSSGSGLTAFTIGSIRWKAVCPIRYTAFPVRWRRSSRSRTVWSQTLKPPL